MTAHCSLVSKMLAINIARRCKNFSLKHHFSSLNKFSSEENGIREAGTHNLYLHNIIHLNCMYVCVVKDFAVNEIKPRVREMDEKEEMNPEIIKKLFELGFMGLEVPAKYDGSEFSFTSSIIVIEGKLRR